MAIDTQFIVIRIYFDYLRPIILKSYKNINECFYNIKFIHYVTKLFESSRHLLVNHHQTFNLIIFDNSSTCKEEKVLQGVTSVVL